MFTCFISGSRRGHGVQIKHHIGGKEKDEPLMYFYKTLFKDKQCVCVCVCFKTGHCISTLIRVAMLTRMQRD